ncbi:GNAT family N-acetyltransferase [Aestuariivirga sp.]|uniref:GNAT family N-acetyltransferase n=1 Tax=Aestuariivirga sp. TaxID=2650926 RepID=UPI0039E4229E
MSVTIRSMADADAPAVVEMVRGLAGHVGQSVPKLTPEGLISSRDLIDVVVAEEENRIIGACLGLMTYSTWRGAKGLYVVDLFVAEDARGRNVGLDLLVRSAERARGKGAEFIKLEVDYLNEGAARFYERHGFVRKDSDRLFILEANQLQGFITRKGRT